MRLGRKELNHLKEKFNVDRIWSYSRLSTYYSQPWVYRMTYLEPERVRTTNIYSIMGGKVHDIIQDFQEGKTKQEDMSDAFENLIMEWRLDDGGHKFISDKVERSYVNNLANYFKNTQKIPYEVFNEKPLYINFKDAEDNNIVFIGYMDSFFKDEDENYHILDYKSSSKGDYTGKKLKSHSQQLQLYAIGVHQLYNVPYDKIKLEFDMMKYYKVSYLQKNGKWKDSIQERESWVISQEKKLRTLLSQNDVEIFEIDRLIANANSLNNIDEMPDYVKDKFILKPCYIEAEINEDIAKEIEDFAVSTVAECTQKEKGNWEEEFPEPIIDEGNRFYFEQLAPQMLKHHKGYQEAKAMNRNGSVDMSLDALDSLFS